MFVPSKRTFLLEVFRPKLHAERNTPSKTIATTDENALATKSRPATPQDQVSAFKMYPLVIKLP